MYHHVSSFIEPILFGPVLHIHNTPELGIALFRPIQRLIEILEIKELTIGQHIILTGEPQSINSIFNRRYFSHILYQRSNPPA